MSGPRTIGVTLALRQNPQDKKGGYLDIYSGDITAIYVLSDEVEGYKYRLELNPDTRRQLADILLESCPSCGKVAKEGELH